MTKMLIIRFFVPRANFRILYQKAALFSQQPEAGEKMTKGTAIVVVVSEGPSVRTLPEISGKTLPDASEDVTAAGFVPTKTEDYSDTVPAGRVIGYQDAKAGSQMAYGSKVVIVVSKGPNPNSYNP
jgi:eukaryotic-like serine/threonine-protein kinase